MPDYMIFAADIFLQKIFYLELKLEKTEIGGLNY